MPSDNVNCRKASSLISAAYERRLTPAEIEALQRHLAACLRCSNFKAQLAFLDKASKLFGSGPHPRG